MFQTLYKTRDRIRLRALSLIRLKLSLTAYTLSNESKLSNDEKVYQHAVEVYAAIAVYWRTSSRFNRRLHVNIEYGEQGNGHAPFALPPCSRATLIQR
jgi:hypothetical protein